MNGFGHVVVTNIRGIYIQTIANQLSKLPSFGAQGVASGGSFCFWVLKLESYTLGLFYSGLCIPK